MSGLFGSTTIKGTRLTDFSAARVSVGDPIAFGYGSFPVDGQVIFAPLPPKEHYSKKRQGKGGVKQEVYTYTLSYAVAFARGPIYGFKWIKRNGKVVYTTDPAAPIEDRNYATKWAQRASFYFGFPDQMPDSIMESYEGSGNVSAHRKLCYIVLEDEDVTEGGGAPAAYEACVVASPPDVYVTSKPYPIVGVESLNVGGEFYRSISYQDPVDELSIFSSFQLGNLRDVLQDYAGEPEELTAASVFVSGIIDTVLLRYSTLPESLQSGSEFRSGLLEETLLRYLNYQPESLTSSSQFIGGVLS